MSKPMYWGLYGLLNGAVALALHPQWTSGEHNPALNGFVVVLGIALFCLCLCPEHPSPRWVGWIGAAGLVAACFVDALAEGTHTEAAPNPAFGSVIMLVAISSPLMTSGLLADGKPKTNGHKAANPSRR